MRFESDNAKAERNRQKHKISFTEAETVYDSPAFFEDHDHSEAEPRYLVIGFSEKGRLLTVSFTLRNEDTIRIISARNATRREAEQYAQAKRQEPVQREPESDADGA